MEDLSQVLKRKEHNADLVFVLLQFFLYAGCALTLCILGVSSYSHAVEVLESGYDQRTGILYLSQKVHQSDIGGGVRMGSFEGTDALVLVEQETGEEYETWIFVYDGYLCEELVAAGSEVLASQAQRIMPMRELRLTLSEGNLLSISLTTNSGTVDAKKLALRSGGGTFNEGNTPPISSFTAGDDAAMSGPTVMSPAVDDVVADEEGGQ